MDSKKLTAILGKPVGVENVEPRSDGIYHSDDSFDPWGDIIGGALYGTYSMDFDVLAIDVLTDIKNRTYNREDLPSDIFRELLCTHGLCDYGSSHRVCFWCLNDDLLDKLIDKWSEFMEYNWVNTN